MVWVCQLPKDVNMGDVADLEENIRLFLEADDNNWIDYNGTWYDGDRMI